MATTIRIPAALRNFTEGQGLIEVSGDSVDAALASLLQKHPSLKNQLCTDDGRLRAFVNVFLNDEDVRFMEKTETVIKPGDTITIVPSIAGGRHRR